MTARRRIASWVARGYVAGNSVEDALRAARELGLPSTVGYWDGPGDAAEHIEAEYGRALDVIAMGDAYLSIKAPSLPDGAVARIAQRARDRGVLLHFDSLAPQTADRVLQLAHEAAGRGADVGVTLPGRWARSVGDAERAAAAGLRVRVVRGQWADPSDDRDRFLDVVRHLADARVAVATHDARLARAALAQAPHAEVELLYGLPLRASAGVARDLGARLRVYVPYGHAWLPYALAEARRNPRIVWWLARDAALGRRRL